MRFICRSWPAICLAAMLAGVAAHPVAAQTGARAPTAATATDNSTQTNAQENAPQQAYTLSPDKLAKAVALNRIRNILEIAGSVWGIVVLWLLLATRGAAGLEGWAQRVAGRRWMQGVVFFAAFCHNRAGRTTPGLDRPSLRASLRD